MTKPKDYLLCVQLKRYVNRSVSPHRFINSATQFQIHVFVFDESYKTLTGLGTVVELGAWYTPEAVISHIAFRGGAQEELLIVDGGTRARVLSLTTQQFR